MLKAFGEEDLVGDASGLEFGDELLLDEAPALSPARYRAADNRPNLCVVWLVPTAQESTPSFHGAFRGRNKTDQTGSFASPELLSVKSHISSRRERVEEYPPTPR